MSSLLADLAGLAWKRCRGDIFAVYNMWLGGVIFAVTYVICTAMRYLNFVTAFPKSLTEQEMGLGGAALYYAGSWGIIDAFVWLTIIAVIVCIFEYLLNLSIVLYYYDNKSWKWVEAIRDANRIIINRWKQSNYINRYNAGRVRSELETEIKAIKNRNKEL